VNRIRAAIDDVFDSPGATPRSKKGNVDAEDFGLRL